MKHPAQLPGLRGQTGFGLVDSLMALALLAVTLLGACGSLHFALGATRTAAWQSRAVDLVSDLNEELHRDDAAPPAGRIQSWRSRIRQQLPSADVASWDARSVSVDGSELGWVDLRLAWNTGGNPQQDTLLIPLPHAVMP